ncbi:MAG: 6-hydroxymethylpterin diphosphokinase MptE-like protein [Treponema sp.]
MTCIWNKIFADNASRFKIRFPELYKLVEKEIQNVIFNFEQYENRHEEQCENLHEKKLEQKNPEHESLHNDKTTNLEILNSVFPFWNFLYSKSGEITAKENDIFLHSAYSPQKEAAHLFEQKPKSDLSYIFAGIGLGYALLEFAKTNPDSLLIIIEPDTKYLLASMSVLDWSAIFSHEKCIIITGSIPEQTVPFIERLSPLDKIKVITQNSQTQHDAQWFRTFFTLLERNRQKQNINNNTLERFSSLWLKNSAKNIHWFPKTQGISIYKNMLNRKYPSLIVAAGPTLQDTIPLLKELKKRTVLIAVDTALKTLLKNNVQPDFVVLIDPQYYAACHIAGLSAPESVLITESSVYPSAMRFDCRKKVFCESLFPLGRYFEQNLLPEKSFGKITAGGSVSTSCWDFAKYIGSKDIYIAGLDLGYPGKKTHVKGSTFEERSYTFSNRLNTAENNLCSILFSTQNETSFDYENNPIITDSKMKLFAWWFESQIAKENEFSCEESQITKTFSLSKKSLKIPGMLTAEPQSLLSLPEIENQKKQLFQNAELNACGFSEQDFKDVYDNLLDMLESLYSTAKKGLSICQKILSESQSIAEQKAKFSFDELSKIDAEILSSKAKDTASLVFPTNRQLEAILEKQPKYSSEILSSIVKSKVIYGELINSIKKYMKNLK